MSDRPDDSYVDERGVTMMDSRSKADVIKDLAQTRARLAKAKADLQTLWIEYLNMRDDLERFATEMDTWVETADEAGGRRPVLLGDKVRRFLQAIKQPGDFS